MDYRCPDCRRDLKTRKLMQAVVTRMETECSFCKRVLRLNVHRAEVVTVLLSFGTILAMAATAYWFESREALLVALGAAMAGSLALPVMEKTTLRSWPRYTSSTRQSDP